MTSKLSPNNDSNNNNKEEKRRHHLLPPPAPVVRPTVGGHAQQPPQQKEEKRPTAAVTSAAAIAMTLDPSLAGVQPSEAVLYVTSMTASRQVRYHCRLMQNLLYLRRVQYTELDVADNPFLQRHLLRLTGTGTGAKGTEHQLPLPLLFIGEQFVGGYEACQALEEEDRLLETMVSKGFVYVPAPLSKPPLQAVEEEEEGEDEAYFTRF